LIKAFRFRQQPFHFLDFGEKLRPHCFVDVTGIVQMGQHGPRFATVRVVSISQNFVQNLLGLFILALGSALLGQLDSAFTEAIERRGIGGPACGRTWQVMQRRPEVVVRELVLPGAQFRLRARHDFFAMRDAGLTPSNFAISDRFYVLCLPKSRQAEDQTGHDEPGNGGEVFHGAIGFYWPSRPISIGVSGF
jgi:hypothetical protein